MFSLGTVRWHSELCVAGQCMPRLPGETSRQEPVDYMFVLAVVMEDRVSPHPKFSRVRVGTSHHNSIHVHGPTTSLSGLMLLFNMLPAAPSKTQQAILYALSRISGCWI